MNTNVGKMMTPHAAAFDFSHPHIGNQDRKLLYIKSADCLANDLVQTIKASGWDVYEAGTINEAETLSNGNAFHVVLADINMFEGGSALKRWEALYSSSSESKWVALLRGNSIDDEKIRDLIGQRFYDFHTLPVDPLRLLITLGHAYGMARLSEKQPAEPESVNDLGIIGNSPIMQDFFARVRKIAPVEASVLIRGESGTGKELTANAIHRFSRRAAAPFVAVNCGSIPPNLIQSELFGHEKGSFTGAHKRKIGRIEAAAGGTIFLDEIGDLPMDLQTHLLRFLQEQTIERVGGTESIHVDARIVAATHVNLEKAVAEGRFREDLYYRLNVVHLTVPLLRDRGSDIDLLAQHFFEKFSAESNPSVKGFSRSALEAMYQHPWPGNIRELINRIRHAVIISDNRLLSPEDLCLHDHAGHQPLTTLAKARETAEKEAIMLALQYARYNISVAANKLGVSRATLYRLMDKYQLEGKSFA